MELRECYERLGGDYEKAMSCLRTPMRVERFLLLFLEDDSYGKLVRSLEKGDREGAFLAAHTLKGICRNLSFTCLLASSTALTEALRHGGNADLSELAGRVGEDYRKTVSAIRMFNEDRKGRFVREERK